MANAIVLVVLAEYEEARVGQDIGQDLIKVETVERRRVDIGRIAAEAEARLDFLRSRPLSESASLRGRERAVIDQLQLLAFRARAFIDAERDGVIDELEAAAERGALDKLAFAAVHRFSALLEALDEPFPTRAAPPNAARRAEELAAIERFLARKNQREVA
jgi:hypothetical protein